MADLGDLFASAVDPAGVDVERVRERVRERRRRRGRLRVLASVSVTALLVASAVVAFGGRNDGQLDVGGSTRRTPGDAPPSAVLVALDGTTVELTVPDGVVLPIGDIELSATVFADGSRTRGWRLTAARGAIADRVTAGSAVPRGPSARATDIVLDTEARLLGMQFGDWSVVLSGDSLTTADVEHLTAGVAFDDGGDGALRYAGTLPLGPTDAPDVRVDQDRESLSLFLRSCSSRAPRPTPAGLTVERIDDPGRDQHLVVLCDPASQVEVWLSTDALLTDQQVDAMALRTRRPGGDSQPGTTAGASGVDAVGPDVVRSTDLGGGWRQTAPWSGFGTDGINGVGREGFSTVAVPLADRPIVLVWGGGVDGGPTYADGAAFDPAANTWAWLPASPLAARSHHIAVWTGNEMIVWGGEARAGDARDVTALGDGAAYDPTTRTWRPIAAAPLPGGASHAATWTGTEMVVVGGPGEAVLATGQSPVISRRVAAYDPLRDAWRTLPDLPLDLSFADAHWSGREVVVSGGQSFTTTQFANLRGPVLVAALDPTGAGSWRTAAEGGPSSQSAGAAWVGDRLLVATYYPSQGPDKAWIGSSDQWVALDGYPLTEGCEGTPTVAAIPSGAVVEVCGHVARLDTGTGTWTVITPTVDPYVSLAPGDTVFTGSELIAVRGDGTATILVP